MMLSIVTVLICSVLATQPGETPTLDSFLDLQPTAPNPMFAGTPIAYQKVQGCLALVKEMYRQNGHYAYFKNIRSDDDDYGLMDTHYKKAGLVQMKKRWSQTTAPTRKAYYSPENTPNPYYKGIFVSKEDSDEEKLLDILYCPASTAKLILKGVQCKDDPAIRHALEQMARPTKHANMRRNYNQNANGADSSPLVVAERERRNNKHKTASKLRKAINGMTSAPDIGKKIDDVSKEGALKRLKKMKTCTWVLQPAPFGSIKQKPICVPLEIHDITAYVEGLHEALAADKLWAVDTEYQTPKGVKAADQPASSMGMSNGVWLDWATI
jgi:hypothetical protein